MNSVLAAQATAPTAAAHACFRQRFDGNLIILGCGAVSRCLQPLIARHLEMDFRRVTLVDFQSPSQDGNALLHAGARFMRQRLTQTNLDRLLGDLAHAGDLIVDLTWNVDTIEIVRWCQAHGVRYVNTSLEVWDPYMPNSDVTADDDTIYSRYVNFRTFAAGCSPDGPTAIIEHGANPGLVNHWVKVGLIDLTRQMLSRLPMAIERRTALEKALAERDFASLAMWTGTKVIHISERDSQNVRRPIVLGEEFVNTWSIDSFYQESCSASELAWGSHERQLPADALLHQYGPRNKIYLRRCGKDVLAYSWVPSGQTVGQITAHGEVFTISEKLTVHKSGNVVYRPSVYFVYQPSAPAMACLRHQLADRALPANSRLLTDEIAYGRDEVGALLLGHDLNGWWVGSRLDIHETRRHVQHQNATTLQVAASLLAAIVYAIRHPNAGVCTADDLDSEEVLAIANPYLSPCESRQTDWRPPKRSPGRDGLWQFANFEFKQEAGKDANTTTFANHATTSLSRGHKVVDAVCQRAL